ncbi:MAG: hypothetical protein WDO71_26895 [Bacteroidota bacterium]
MTDSTVIPLFFPRLRFEHTFQYGQFKYEFRDYIGDSAYYKDNYGLTLGGPIDTVQSKDQWKEFINDFSIYQFPDAKNLQQFIKVEHHCKTCSRNCRLGRNIIMCSDMRIPQQDPQPEMGHGSQW